MLELIVLGQVPGTSIQITFKMVLGIATVFIGGLLVQMVSKRAKEALQAQESVQTTELALQ